MTTEDLAPSRRPSTGRGRLYFADRLRVLLTALVVVHHAALTYSSLPLWYYHETGDGNRLPLDLLLLLNQGFFMGLFFLIAGYFTPGALERSGAGRFTADRLLRLGVPLVAGYFVIVPAAKLIGRRGNQSFSDGYLTELEPGPFWFIATLLLFALGYAGWQRLIRGRARPMADDGPKPPLRARQVVGFTAVIAVLSIAWRLWPPVDRVPLLEVPTPEYLPQYLGMFVAGVAMYRRDWLDRLPTRASVGGLAAAVAATVVLVPIAVADGGAGDSIVGRVAFGLWNGCYGVGMSIGLLALFRNRFGGPPRRPGRFLTGNAYAVYVVHAVVLVIVSVAVSQLSAGPLAKFALVAAMGVPLSWAVAALLRAVPGATKVL